MTTALLERIHAHDLDPDSTTEQSHGPVSPELEGPMRPVRHDGGAGGDDVDAGLTGLQELAVAILVVAILVVGGLFAFGAFKGTANNSVGQQTAINTLQDAHGIYANNSSAYPATTEM